MKNVFILPTPKPEKLEWYQVSPGHWTLRIVPIEPTVEEMAEQIANFCSYKQGEYFTTFATNAKPDEYPSITAGNITYETLRKAAAELPPIRVRQDGWMRTFLPDKLMLDTFKISSAPIESVTALYVSQPSSDPNRHLCTECGQEHFGCCGQCPKHPDNQLRKAKAENKQLWVEWAEPIQGNDLVTQRMKAEDAIAQMRRTAKQRKYEYPTDGEALREFIIVYWATLVETEKQQ